VPERFKLVSEEAGTLHFGFAELGPTGTASAEHQWHQMSKEERIIQLVKIALGILIAGYFFWWSLEVLKRLPPPH
jgi:hypothetical protein